MEYFESSESGPLNLKYLKKESSSRKKSPEKLALKVGVFGGKESF